MVGLNWCSLVSKLVAVQLFLTSIAICSFLEFLVFRFYCLDSDKEYKCRVFQLFAGDCYFYLMIARLDRTMVLILT